MVGIAIINYKTFQKTINCIKSIRDTVKMDYKIYLLDNASGNESSEVLNNEYCGAEDVEVILSEINYGYARGNNICIRRMLEDGCDMGLISNNDIVCSAGAIDKMVMDLKENPEYLLVGPKIISPQGDFQQSIKMKPYTTGEYLRKSTYLANFYMEEISIEREAIQKIDTFTEVSWVSGAFFAFDLQKMKEIEMFDSNTFLFFEEYILAAKPKKMGYKLGYEPEATVLHYHGASTGGGVNIISKKAADTSELYYFHTYTKVSCLFVVVLKAIRSLEVLYTFGKKRDLKSIKKYFFG